MRLTPIQGHVVVFLVAGTIGMMVFFLLQGYGYYSFGPVHLNKAGIAGLAAFIFFGLYYRYAHAPIAPNTQGIQTCLGTQTGEVWGEGNFHFIPRPVWDIWREESIEHFTFTVVAQNRSSEGHQMMVFATGRGIPTDAYMLAKMENREHLVAQLLAKSMQTIGAYIHRETRENLYAFPGYNLSEWFEYDRAQEGFNTYGVKVELSTTKVIEVNPQTMAQFDVLARSKDMDVLVKGMEATFPGTSAVERYAMYATMVGFNPAVMSHVVHGQGNFFFGSSPNT